MKIGGEEKPVSLLAAVLCALAVVLTGVPEAPCRSRQGEAESRPALGVSLDKSAAAVGETLTLTIDYRLPEGARLPEEVALEGLDGLTVIDRRVRDGRIVLRFLVDRLGSLKTGALALPYLSESGTTERLKADPLTLSIFSSLGEKPEQARLRPIQDIMATRNPWRPYLPWFAAAAALLLASLLAFGIYRRRRRRMLGGPAPEPPHLQARRAIEELEGRRLFESGRVKAYYFSFSEIIRIVSFSSNEE